jgi:hypothetical protein
VPVVQNTARDPAGNGCRATVTIRLIAGDVGSVNTPGYSIDGTVLGITQVRADVAGFWSVELDPNADYEPVGTFYEVIEQPPGTAVAYVHHIEVPDEPGTFDLAGLLVDTDPPAPATLYLLAAQKGAAGGLATLDEDGQVPADQLGNASGGGGGGAVSSVFGRTGAVTAQSGDYTKAQVGLSSVDNTSDAGKPVSTLQAAADTAVAAAAAAALAAHEADTTAVHGIINTASLVLTNDSRLTDARTPTVHAGTHASAGSDPVTLAQSQVTGLTAALSGKQDADADLAAIAGLDSGTAGALTTDGAGWIRKTYAALKTALALVKGDVGLGNVDNTSDTGKPVSAATQTALNAKVTGPANARDLGLALFSGTTGKVATGTDHLYAEIDGNDVYLHIGDPNVSGEAAFVFHPNEVDSQVLRVDTNSTGDSTLVLPSLGGTLARVEDVTSAVAASAATRQPLDGDLTTIAGLTATTDNMIQSVGSAWASRTPAQVRTALAVAPLASPTLTGTPAAPTAAQGTNTTQIATTAYVQTEVGLLVPKSLVDAKGDLLVGSANDTVARLAVGSDGQVLTADAASTNGVKWATAAGGAGTDFKVATKPRTGKWYRAPSFGPVGSNLSMSTLNRCYFVPFRLAASTTFDRIGVDVATAGTATAVLRLGIYSPDAAGDLPGTLILDAGTVAGDALGAKQATISQLLAAGMYWLCVCNQVASGTAIRAVTSYDPLIEYSSGASMFTGTTAPGAVVATGITGAFASNPTINDNDNGPIIGLRAA